MIHAYVHECTLIGRGMYTQMHRMQIENVFPFRVDVYARMYKRKKKKKRKNAVSNMANGSLFSQTDNDSVWVFRISSLTKFHVVQQWSGKLKKY